MATGLPGIVLVHVTVAGATTGLGLNILTGCGPISLGVIENTIVPVILDVAVRVSVDTIWPTSGATALLNTLSRTCNKYVPGLRLTTLMEAEKPITLPDSAVT